MNRFTTHLNPRLRVRRSAGAGLATAAAAALAAGTLLSGCGTGQISQTAGQAPAVNGNDGSVGQMKLRDVRIQAEQSTGDFLKPGRTVDLVFVAANESPETADELTDISTEIGKVSLTGDKKIPAGTSLVVGPAAGHGSHGAESAGKSAKTAAAVTLDKPITNGLTYTFTFDFTHAGKISLAVPISAGTPARP